MAQAATLYVSQVDFAAPADYIEPKRPSPKASPVSTSPMQKSPLMESLGAPKLDEDSSDEDERETFQGAGFRLDGKAIKAPKVAQGGNLLGGDVRIGVRIGGDGQVLSSDAPAAVAAPASAAAVADGDDYWAKFSSQGQKLR